MKLRFIDAPTASQLVALIKRHGYASSQYIADGWIVVESAIDGPARRKLMREWCHISLEDNTKPDNQQRKLL